MVPPTVYSVPPQPRSARDPSGRAKGDDIAASLYVNHL